MIRITFPIVIVLMLLGGCKSLEDDHPADLSRLNFSTYLFTDYNTAFPSLERQHWDLALARCGMQPGYEGAKLGSDCVVYAVTQSLPESKPFAQACAVHGNYILVADCLVNMALATGIARMTDDTTISLQIAMNGSRYPHALGNAASNLAKSIWKSCPTGAEAADCRAGEATSRLELSADDRSGCARLPADREIFQCLVGTRVTRDMRAAIKRLSAL